jgi:hypothetical protein
VRPCTACNTTTTWGWDVYANDVGPEGLDNIKAFILNYDAERRISSRRMVLAAGFSDIEFLSTLSYQEQDLGALATSGDIVTNYITSCLTGTKHCGRNMHVSAACT